MTAPTPRERLYALLPAVHRLHDAAQGEPLRALMAVFERELAAIETDIETTWDNWFVETCEEWLVPYLGAALGVGGLRDGGGGGLPLRGYVANTLRRRRRKGTAAATEQLARDVTGYPARAVELFALTATTVAPNHLRGADRVPAPVGTVDLRAADRLEHVGGPFDPFAHTVDVRPVADGVVRHNLPNLALHLWRARSAEVSRSSARPVAGAPAGWFDVDPLGATVPLFTLPASEEDIVALAGPEHVPHELGRIELDRLGDEVDPPVAVTVVLAGVEKPLTVVAADLSEGPGGLPTARPAAGTVAVDPHRGRLLLAAADTPAAAADDVLVDHVHGTPGQLGAGPDDRSAFWERQRGDLLVDEQWLVARDPQPPGDPGPLPTLAAAIAAWNAFIDGVPPARRPDTTGLIVVADSRRHEIGATPVELPGGARLAVVAGTWPVRDEAGVPVRVAGEVVAAGVRPHLVGTLEVVAEATAGADRRGELLLDGLLLEGSVTVAPGDLGRLDLACCTVTGGVAVAGGGTPGPANADLSLRLVRSISGPLTATAPAGAAVPVTELRATDSAVTAGPAPAGAARAVRLPAAALHLDGCTVIGGLVGRTLEASECILDEGHLPPDASLAVTIRQEGCVRFSYLPRDARAPRRYRCQPDLALAGAAPSDLERVRNRVRPAYGSEVPHTAGYLLLSTGCPVELRTAAADGAEPGVWHHLGHALRMSNLSAALRQYLRFGLEAGAIVDR